MRAMAMGLAAALALVVLAWAAGAWAADGGTDPAVAAQFRRQCREDYKRFCTGAATDPAGLQKACLRQYFLNLSASCKTAIHALEAPPEGG